MVNERLMMQAHYSQQLVDDLITIHGLSAEDEISRILKHEINNELNRMGLDPDDYFIIRELNPETNIVNMYATRKITDDE